MNIPAHAPRGPTLARPAQPARPERPLVLVVEDDACVRRALERLLRAAGLDVLAFGSAAELVDAPLPDRPCCAILDLRLPGSNGLDLQHMLLAEARELPIVFVSGHADVPSGVRALKAGAPDFLLKPFTDQALLAAVQRALERDRHARQERALRAQARQRFDRLTAREQQVMALVTQGKLNKQVAGELGISEKTVKFHRGRVMEKMQADSLAELVRLADRVGLPARAA